MTNPAIPAPTQPDPKPLLESAMSPSGAFAPPSPDVLTAAIPGFAVEALIGQGGQACVYRAIQRSTGRSVALKVLAPHLSRDLGFAARFARESRTLAKLSHPNLVAVLEAGQDGDWCWLALELVEGATLRDLLRTGRLAPAEALGLIRQLCDAVTAIHAADIVHRDIKPENILIDATGHLRLTDFGLAKVMSAHDSVALTHTGATMGTVHYMAPEQVEGAREVDHRADLYACGVVFYELLTGGLPLGRFDAPSAHAKVDRSIDLAVFKSLEKDPDKRFQQASELSAAVQAADANGSNDRAALNNAEPQRPGYASGIGRYFHWPLHVRERWTAVNMLIIVSIYATRHHDNAINWLIMGVVVVGAIAAWRHASRILIGLGVVFSAWVVLTLGTSNPRDFAVYLLCQLLFLVFVLPVFPEFLNRLAQAFSAKPPFQVPVNASPRRTRPWEWMPLATFLLSTVLWFPNIDKANATNTASSVIVSSEPQPKGIDSSPALAHVQTRDDVIQIISALQSNLDAFIGGGRRDDRTEALWSTVKKLTAHAAATTRPSAPDVLQLVIQLRRDIAGLQNYNEPIMFNLQRELTSAQIAAPAFGTIPKSAWDGLLAELGSGTIGKPQLDAVLGACQTWWFSSEQMAYIVARLPAGSLREDARAAIAQRLTDAPVESPVSAKRESPDPLHPSADGMVELERKNLLQTSAPQPPTSTTSASSSVLPGSVFTVTAPQPPTSTTSASVAVMSP